MYDGVGSGPACPLYDRDGWKAHLRRHGFPTRAAIAMRVAMLIRTAFSEDALAIGSTSEPVIRAGETDTLGRDMTEEQAFADRMGSDEETLVAAEDGIILGISSMRPNRAGGGRHVCNGGIVVSADATGRGIAGRRGEPARAYARSRRSRGRPFTVVVSTNERAVRLWQKLGFEIVGRLPFAFHHPAHGDGDA